jgi:fatty acid desaturase
MALLLTHYGKVKGTRMTASNFTNSATRRDYSLTGKSAISAVEIGLASAEWYHTEVPRKTMKELMQRRDGPAIRDTLIWFAILISSGAVSTYFWGTWWCLPFLFVYGLFYASAADSRWHECGHGTAFKTRWMNETVYQFASFMMMRNPVIWRWSHTRHHTDTIIVGRDPEIIVMRPLAVLSTLSNFFGVADFWYSSKELVQNAFGKIDEDHLVFIPGMEVPKVVGAARVHLTIDAIVIALSIYLSSWLPVVLIILPRLYGAWHQELVGLLQHGGLADNVIDHRLNTRTVYMNPISRFVYWNMNYHVEHHMFPMVPYHALPRLHQLIKPDLPAPNKSIFQAYCEMIPAILKQLRNPDYSVKRELPPTAKPYLEQFHTNESLPNFAA